MILEHQPRLDGIRAVAVAMVLQQHFTTFMGKFGFGAMGVRLFFVLSGYLISRIIFDCEPRHSDNRSGHPVLLAPDAAPYAASIFCDRHHGTFRPEQHAARLDVARVLYLTNIKVS